MSLRTANGAVLSIASGYGTSKTMSAITNATEAVATLESSHGVIVSDLVEVTSGWDGLNGRIARAKTVATNDVTFEKIDTSSTSLFPAGSGIGSVREISSWATISQIRSMQRSGGEQQYTDGTLLADLMLGRQVPTFQSPIAINITVADDPTLSWLDTVKAAMNSRALAAGRIAVPGGGYIYFNAYWSVMDFPSFESGALLEIPLNLSLVSLHTRYAS